MKGDIEISELSEDEQYEVILDTMYEFIDDLIRKGVNPQLAAMAMIEMTSYSMYVTGDRDEYEEMLEFGKTFEWPDDKPTLH